MAKPYRTPIVAADGPMSDGSQAGGKTAEQSPVPVGCLVPQPHGGALLHGNPGNRGGPGRPRDEFYDWLEGVLRDPKVRERYEAIMQQSDPETFLKALKWGDERLRGKPGQSVDLNVDGKPTLLLGPVPESDE